LAPVQGEKSLDEALLFPSGTLGFAIGAEKSPQVLAFMGIGGLVAILVASLAVLLRGHLGRSVLSLMTLMFVALAASA
jgi:hypothetical protein